MAILPEAGAVTVAANFRLMYDKRSELATNNAFVTGLRRAERQALEIANEADSELVRQHKELTKELQAISAHADAEMVRQASQTQKFITTQRRAAVAAAQKPVGTKISGMDMAGVSPQFQQDLKQIEAHMRGFHSRMQSMGHFGQGGKSFEEDFATAGYRTRQNVIRELEGDLQDLIQVEGEETNAVRILKSEIDNLRRANDTLSSTYERTSRVKTDAERKSRESARKTRMEQSRLRQERLDSIHAMRMHVQTSQQLSMAIGMGLRTAVMHSAIALMTLGMRLNQTIETFKEFERELMNAQSIFQTTQDVLFGLSDQVAKFGTQYGIEINQAAQGLYTLASAGLTAAESQEVLNNTLKLSMAVQGDHETIAKLTTQTIFGFGLEMSDSAELTDKFAHAINKSLIEYQDLASAVKFAMPIAGRGLRQALAEFAQHADDNTAAFRKLGVEITDTNGNFLMLTEIAKNFQTQMGESINDTELLTTLLEDLNVRGATAFVHLVQNADEFQAAVDDLANSAGSATEMANIQQQSLANTIQRVKMADGTYELTQFGHTMKTMIIEVLHEFHGIMLGVIEGIKRMSEDGSSITTMFRTMLIPLKVLLKIFQVLPDGLLTTLMMFRMLNQVLPVNIMLQLAETKATMMASGANKKLVASMVSTQKAMMVSQAVMFGSIMLMNSMGEAGSQLIPVLGMLAGAMYMYNFAKSLGTSGIMFPAAVLAGAVAGGMFFSKLGEAMNPSYSAMSYRPVEPGTYDLGGRIYDNGGRIGSRHFPVMVEPGETIIPKTQNMLGSGITLNIQGDIVTNDADDFAERIANVLPNALRKINDTGGI